MNFYDKVIMFLKKPLWIVLYLSNHGFRVFSDEKYLKIVYKLKLNKKLNLNNPTTYNEKLQWLKLHDRKKEYIDMVDKYAAKQFVSKKIGSEYVIPTLGIYDSFDDINFDELPNQFVIKCTHDSGGLFIVKDKNSFDCNKAKKIINKCFKKNYYNSGREWPYKNVKPRIIIEEYKEDSNTKELRDYKYFCFNGKVEMMFISSNRQGEGDTYFDFFDKDFNHLPFRQGHPNAPVVPEKPINHSKMIELAEKLSSGIPHVRIDFYEVDNKIFFGEMTFYHFSGFTPFESEEWDNKIGDMLDLSKVFKNEK